MFSQGIHHVAIICSNYEVSKKFYTEVLGFRIIEETYREDRKSYMLDLAVDKHTQIELFSFPNPPKRLSEPEALGLRHLAFKADDVHKVRKYLEKEGVEVMEMRTDPVTGKEFFFFLDPDKLPLEVYSTS